MRELGSGKVGYNKYELVNVMMVRKMDGAYFASKYLRLGIIVYGDQSHTSIQLPVNIWIAVPVRETYDTTRALAHVRLYM